MASFTSGCVLAVQLCTVVVAGLFLLLEFGIDGGIIGLLGCGSSEAWLNCFVFGLRSGALVS